MSSSKSLELAGIKPGEVLSLDLKAWRGEGESRGPSGPRGFSSWLRVSVSEVMLWLEGFWVWVCVWVGELLRVGLIFSMPEVPKLCGAPPRWA